MGVEGGDPQGPCTHFLPLCLLLFATQRAGEVEKAEPKIAYYCRLYAVEQVGGPGEGNSMFYLSSFTDSRSEV